MAGVVAVMGGGGFATWKYFKPPDIPAGFVRSNGRLEAERIDIATKLAGRISGVLVKEGDTVTAGQILAKMDTQDIEAQIREAAAAVLEAEQQQVQADAVLAQRRSELTLADQQLDRSTALVLKGFATRETMDTRTSAKLTAVTAVSSARSQIVLTKATIQAAVAKVDDMKTSLVDSTLLAPRSGRIQYRLALPGEVLDAGCKVLTMLDLGEVYMTTFLPTKDVGRLALGSEARNVLDAAPQYVFPASVSFVAADAQFMPKYVETPTEREKLMYRVKLQLPRDLLERNARYVKTGVLGTGTVRLPGNAAWPAGLVVKLPD